MVPVRMKTQPLHQGSLVTRGWFRSLRLEDLKGKHDDTDYRTKDGTIWGGEDEEELG